MHVLVTGNLGYVGPVVTRHLRRTFPDATIVGLDSGFYANCLTADPADCEPVLDHQYFADVRSLPWACLRGVTDVVHLAAISNDPIGNQFEQVTLDINHRATAELALRAKIAGVRTFTLASSCSVYGAAEGARNERSPLNPLTAYSRSKVLAERDVSRLAGRDFTVTCLRFATACGMSERLRLDLVLNDFVASAVASARVTLLSDGSAWRPLIHVRDMARAIEWAMGRDGDHGGNALIVNTGSNSWNYRVRALAEAVAEEIPGIELEVGEGAVADPRSYKVDFSLFRQLAPDHQPRTTLPIAVRELRDGLDGIRFDDCEFRNSHLIRLHVLDTLRARHRLTETLEWQRSRS